MNNQQPKKSTNGKEREFEVGDIVELKKRHPCGSNKWELQRVGMDFKIKCLGCSHTMMIARSKVERSIKKVEHKTQAKLR